MTQDEALDILKTGRNVFLTGSAGSGKTFVLNKYLEYLRAHNVEVGITASTGIASTHIGGMTIHSWAGIGIKDNLTEQEFRNLSREKRLAKRFEKTKVLVIDEISMLHHFRLDLVDRVLQMFCGSFEPFGGMQVILCGDFFQLPPVSRNGDVAHFVHQSAAWSNMDVRICYLEEQYRQEDERFLRVLNDIRGNRVNDATLAPLRERYRKEIKLALPVTPTKLHVHNIDVDAENFRELGHLTEREHVYKAETKGPRTLVEMLKRSVLAPETLAVKEGAMVMFVKNNFEIGYVNGTLGKVVDFEEGFPIVETVKGKRIVASPESWSFEDVGGGGATIAQVPLRLAWAITVHKSQGMSLDAAEIDLSKSFVPGMGYVALSRLRTLLGLKLMGMNEMALKVAPESLALDDELREMSDTVRRELQALPLSEKKKQQEEFLGKIRGKVGKKPEGGGALEKIREKHPQAYKKWEKGEEDRLALEFQKGKHMEELAELFGRKEGGIRSRLVKLGLVEE